MPLGLNDEAFRRALLVSGLNVLGSGAQGANLGQSLSGGLIQGLQAGSQFQRQQKLDKEQKAKDDLAAQTEQLQQQSLQQQIAQQKQQQQQAQQQQALQQLRASKLQPVLGSAQKEMAQMGKLSPETEAKALSTFQNPALQFENPIQSFQNNFGYNPYAAGDVKHSTAFNDALSISGAQPGTDAYRKVYESILLKKTPSTNVNVNSGPAYTQTKTGLLIDKNDPKAVEDYNKQIKVQHDSDIHSKIQDQSTTVDFLDKAQGLLKSSEIPFGSGIASIERKAQSLFGGTTDVQNFDALAKQFTLAKAKLLGANPSEGDRKFIEGASIGLDKTKEANQQIIDRMREIAQKTKSNLQSNLFYKPKQQDISGMSTDQLLKLLKSGPQ